MIVLVLLAPISCATLVFCDTSSGPLEVVSSCPNLTPSNISLEFGYEIQPFFATFAPLSPAVAIIDNICYTFLPLPDGSNIYQQFISTVYTNGYNTVKTSIVTQKQLGTTTNGSPECTFVDIMFFNIFEDEISCTTNINYRCFLHGECDRPALGALPLYGMSFKRKPISEECLRIVNNVVLSNGLGSQVYYSFPMNLPSRCVFKRTGNALQTTQRSQDASGVNVYQRSNC